MHTQYDIPTLSLLTGDEIIEIENAWYNKTFALGKMAYYVISSPNEEEGILVEVYDSKEKFSTGGAPRSTTIVDYKLIESNKEVIPSNEIIAIVYGKNVFTTKIILDDPNHFPIIERESGIIQFSDGTFMHKSLYQMAEDFKHLFCQYDLITTTTTSLKLSSVTAFDAHGDEVAQCINRKSYMAAFDLTEKILKIYKTNNLA